MKNCNFCDENVCLYNGEENCKKSIKQEICKYCYNSQNFNNHFCERKYKCYVNPVKYENNENYLLLLDFFNNSTFLYKNFFLEIIYPIKNLNKKHYNKLILFYKNKKING